MNQRVTNTMMHGVFMSDMQNNLGRMLEIQRQILTEQKYQKPSDNPIDVARMLGLSTNITENTQYQKNMDDALTWLKNTDNTFNQMTSIYQRIRELSIYAGDGGLEDVDMNAIAKEMSELREQLRVVANYSVEGRFLLSGLATGVEPFIVDASGKVVYQGGTGHIEFEMERGQNGRVSFNGKEVFPSNMSDYTVKGFEVPIDFEWKGRDEIIQIQVGNRMAKVRIPEKWPDELRDNIADETDFNKYRDPEEQEGYTLDEIAKLMNESMSMGDMGKIAQVKVVKDLNRGVQYLQIESHTGEPVRITGWPETDKVDVSQNIKGEQLTPPFVPSEDGKISIRFDNDMDVVHEVNVKVGPPPSTLQDIADELMNINGIWAKVETDPVTGKEWLSVVSEKPGEKFTLEASGGAMDMFHTFAPGEVRPEKVTRISEPAQKNTDHSHIDLMQFLGMETTTKSTEVPPGTVWDTTLNGGGINLKFQSGNNKANIIINDMPNLTLEELAKRINSTCGRWLEAIVETDQSDASGGMSGANGEGGTQRLVLRTLDGAPLNVYDGDTTGANFASKTLGINTAIKGGANSVTYPSAPNFDPNVPAIMDVQVGSETYRVRLCQKTAGTPFQIMDEIVAQVNKQAGSKLLSVDRTSAPGALPESFALVSLTGQPVRAIDRGYGDPQYAKYTSGIATQLGISAGINTSGTTTLANATAGAPGSIRISSMGHSVDVPVLAGDTLQELTERIKGLTGDWMDVSWYDPSMGNNPNANVSMSLSAKDGAPLSITDISGNAAALFGMNTDLRSHDMSGYTVNKGDTITLGVNGMSHTIDLSPVAGKGIDDVANFINSRFQGGDIAASVVSGAGGTKALSLSSPWGYNVSIESAPASMGYSGTEAKSGEYLYDSTLVPPGSPMGLDGTFTITDDLGTVHNIPLGPNNTVENLSDAINALGIAGFTASVDSVTDSNGNIVSQSLKMTGGAFQTSFVPNPPSTKSPNITMGGLGQKSPVRGNPVNDQYNQKTVVRTSANAEKMDFFGLIDNLIAAVENQDREGISRSILGKVTAWGDNLLRVRAEEGAMENRYTMSKARLTTNNLNMTELKSQIGDVDLTSAITQLQMAMAVYQAGLAVTAKIIQPTLVDFLR